MKTKVQVIRRLLTRLRRGDKLLAVRWRDCGQREAGVSQRSPVIGEFILRHERGDEVAVVYRGRDGKVHGHESSYAKDSVAFVLAEKAEGGAA